jgi:hypothetical protein
MNTDTKTDNSAQGNQEEYSEYKEEVEMLFNTIRIGISCIYTSYFDAK